MQVKIRRLRPSAILPQYATEGSAGMDLCADIDEPREIHSCDIAMVSTGLSIEIPPGYEGQIRPRSGLAKRHGITVLNSPGTIDSDFRGEVSVLLVNHGPAPFIFCPGDRIAQLVIAPVTRVEWQEVEELEETERGSGGFGSTGR